MLNEMGISVVDFEDAEEAEKEAPEPPRKRSRKRANSSRRRVPPRLRPETPSLPSGPTIRADVPARMGSVELLSREGEIAIAKRIEAGREAMIAGLCESPLTFQAIIIWRDELNETKILLRDMIDLEATYAGPDGKKTPKVDMTAPGAAEALAAQIREGSASTAPQTPPDGFDGDAPPAPDNFEDDDDLGIPFRFPQWKPN